MFRFTITFLALLLAQQSTADVLEDAETALNELRHATSEALTAGFLRHIQMSIDIDMAALATKEAAMSTIAQESGKLSCYRAAAQSVVECVNERADGAISLIYKRSSKLADKALKITYDMEMNIVHCGRADEECLAGVTQEIKQKTEDVDDSLDIEIDENQADIEDDIVDIKACATEIIIPC